MASFVEERLHAVSRLPPAWMFFFVWGSSRGCAGCALRRPSQRLSRLCPGTHCSAVSRAASSNLHMRGREHLIEEIKVEMLVLKATDPKLEAASGRRRAVLASALTSLPPDALIRLLTCTASAVAACNNVASSLSSIGASDDGFWRACSVKGLLKLHPVFWLLEQNACYPAPPHHLGLLPPVPQAQGDPRAHSEPLFNMVTFWERS